MAVNIDITCGAWVDSPYQQTAGKPMTTRRRLAFLVAIVLSGSCGEVGTQGGDGGMSPDAPPGTPDAAPPACNLSQPFGAPQPIPGVNSTDSDALAWLS